MAAIAGGRPNPCGAPVEPVWRFDWCGRGGAPRDTVQPRECLRMAAAMAGSSGPYLPFALAWLVPFCPVALSVTSGAGCVFWWLRMAVAMAGSSGPYLSAGVSLGCAVSKRYSHGSSWLYGFWTSTGFWVAEFSVMVPGEPTADAS